jgi:hypothetical protein
MMKMMFAVKELKEAVEERAKAVEALLTPAQRAELRKVID